MAVLGYDVEDILKNGQMVIWQIPHICSPITLVLGAACYLSLQVRRSCWPEYEFCYVHIVMSFGQPDMPDRPVGVATWALQMWLQWNGGDGEACSRMVSLNWRPQVLWMCPLTFW